jgi:hypothetical protein
LADFGHQVAVLNQGGYQEVELMRALAPFSVGRANEHTHILMVQTVV